MVDSVYANAVAKSKENGLLGIDRLYRMIDTESSEDGLKILLETNFGGGIVVDSPYDFEKLIDGEEKSLYEFIEKTCPRKAFRDFLLCKNDFHNAEAYVKAKYLKKDVEDMLVFDGVIKKDLLKEKIFNDDYNSFSNYLKDALKKADEEFVSGKATGQTINSIFRRAMYLNMQEYAKKDKILLEIYSVLADCENISLALRCRNYIEAKKWKLDGGSITDNQLKVLSEEPIETLKEKCRFFSCKEMVYSALDDYIIGKPLSEFENKKDSFALKLLKKNKYDSSGIHPFLTYCYYKLNEILNVRIIMVGLINNLDGNSIKRRLRETYEG